MAPFPRSEAREPASPSSGVSTGTKEVASNATDEALARAADELTKIAAESFAEVLREYMVEFLRLNGRNLPPAPAAVESAVSPTMQDIDAVLARLDVGIAKQRMAMDKLLERIHQPAT